MKPIHRMSLADLRQLLLLTLAVIPEVINSSLSGVAGSYINGSLALSPDEGSWYGLAYLLPKVGFLPLAAWSCKRFGPRHVLLSAALLVLLASLMPLLWQDYLWHLPWRVLQGAAGALVLVAAQLLLVQRFPLRRQGAVQAFYALAVVVLPMTVLPALLGQLVATADWRWAYGLNLALGLPTFWLLLRYLPLAQDVRRKRLPLDWPTALLLAPGLGMAVYVLAEGGRYNWFDDAHIRWLALTAAGLLLVSLLRLGLVSRGRRLLDVRIFVNPSFAFAYPISHLAGYILFGGGFLLQSLSLGALGFAADTYGGMLLPSSLSLALALLAAGLLLSRRGLPPVALVPFGLGLMVWAIWLLAQSAVDSGQADLLLGGVLRGAGMGLLYLAVTLIALSRLARSHQADGVALFNLGRQLGGIVGMSVLQRVLANEAAQNQPLLASAMDRGRVSESLGALAHQLGDHGITRVAALFSGEVRRQVWVLSVNDAFLSLIVLIACALPVVLAFKLVQKKTGWTH